MNKKRLEEIIERHKKWLNKEKGGEWADLSGADLSGADLRGADLSEANLSGADMSGADLRYAKMPGPRIEGAKYRIAWRGDVLAIGCEQHTRAEWESFDDRRIIEMDGKEALKWWRTWKPIIFAMMDAAKEGES